MSDKPAPEGVDVAVWEEFVAAADRATRLQAAAEALRDAIKQLEAAGGMADVIVRLNDEMETIKGDRHEAYRKYLELSEKTAKPEQAEVDPG